MKVKSLSRVRLLATPWTAAYTGSSIREIFLARVLECGAIAFSVIFLYNNSNMKWNVIKIFPKASAILEAMSVFYYLAQLPI